MSTIPSIYDNPDTWSPGQHKASEAEAHTSDPTKYTKPDSHQARIIGSRTTVLPRARNDGTSQGFNHNIATDLIVVDNEDEGTGRKVAVDLRQFAAKSPTKERVEESEMFTVFEDFANKQRQQTSTIDDLIKSASSAPIPRKAENIDFQMPNSNTGNDSTMVTELFKLVTQLVANQVHPIREQPASPAPMSQTTLPSNATAIQSIGSTFQGEAEGSSPVCTSLNIPFITGDKPEKAKVEVLFEIPNLGVMSARYHAVVEGNQSLVLVYDTRFEDGNQYVPPELHDVLINVKVPKLKQSWLCLSTGLHFSLGALDFVVLVTSPST